MMFKKILQGWRPYLAICLIGFALYARTITFDFTYLDDNALILDNYPIISRFENIGLVFSNDVFFSPDKYYYRPIVNLSLMIDEAIGGIDPAIFHLTNVLLHILAACLVFWALRKMAKNRGLSLFLALLFLVHPVLSQAVAWIPGRNDSLLAIFSLSAWIAYLYYSERPRLWTYFGYLVFFWFALLTKESAVILPFFVFLHFFWLETKRVSRPDRWLLVTGSGAVLFFWIVMRELALGSGADLGGGLSGVFGNLTMVLLYLGKLLFPFNLQVFPVRADSTLYYGAAALAILIFALWRTRQPDYRRIIFGFLWFLIFLLPSFIRPTGLADFLEHRLYLSFFGFLLVLSELEPFRSADWGKRWIRWSAAGIIVLFASVSFWHSGVFRDRLTFWEAAAAGSPHSPLAQRNLGAMYYLDGNYDAAERYYRRAIELNDTEVMAHNNLGLIYLERGELDRADAEFQRELEINPNYAKALFNLGEVLDKRGRTEEAVRYWQAALVADPAYGEAYARLLNWQNRIK